MLFSTWNENGNQPLRRFVNKTQLIQIKTCSTLILFTKRELNSTLFHLRKSLLHIKKVLFLLKTYLHLKHCVFNYIICCCSSCFRYYLHNILLRNMLFSPLHLFVGLQPLLFLIPVTPLVSSLYS